MTKREPQGAQTGADRIVPRLLHDQVGVFMSRAWDGELSAEEAQALARHLRECRECWDWAKQFLDFLVRVGPALRKVCRGRDDS